MGRKGRRNAVGKLKSVSNDKSKLAKMLDSRIVKHKETNQKLQQDSSALKQQFEPLFQRFQRSKEQEVSHVVVYHDENEAEEDVPDEFEEESQERTISKKKLRKASKPSLTELKRSVAFPELIQWYDCDAPYPYLLASIKSSKNTVPVPEHWQNKKEYLSGRSYLEKRPFELPEIIKETDIENMRQIMPGGDETKDQSLKETARTRVQPKVGSLDIDYKKLHDVIFKLGANWKPDILLPFGDLFYENRNLYEEARWSKFVREKKPGKISAELRKIMNIGEGKLPPWCMKMKSLGMPPGYPNLKIAGLNWGIENIKGDTYGTLSSEKDSREKVKYFGEMIAMDKRETKAPKTQTDHFVEDKYERQQRDSQSVSLDSLELKPQGLARTAEREAEREAPRELYKVLDERTSDSLAGTTGSKAIYLMSGPQQNVEGETSQEADENERHDHIENFKF